MTALVTVADHGAVRTLVIDGPKRRNALAVSTVDSLTRELRRAEDDRSVGAVVLTGAAGHFSAGGDAESVLGAIADESDDATVRLMRSYHQVVETVWHSPLPVVAAVSGVAYGGAFNLALACDLVVCSEDARFCQVYLRRGVVPDMGGAYLLPRLIGMQRAKELMLLAEEIDAERAHGLGLVNAVLPTPAEALEKAQDIAATLATRPRLAVAQTKKMLNAATSGTLGSALDLEAVTWAAVLGSPSARQGFNAIKSK